MHYHSDALTTSEALLLQQINESGQEDIDGLVHELRESRSSVLAQLTHLKRKGLIVIRETYGNIWIQLSQNGKRVLRELWPEAHTI